MIVLKAATVLCLVACLTVPARADSPPAPNVALSTPEGVCRELYRIVSVKPGETTDWEAARALFIPQAVLVLRVTKETTDVFSVQGWIDDFVAYDERAKVIEHGYRETVVSLVPLVFRDIAHVLVHYEAAIVDSPRPPTQGVDSIELVKKDGRWRIASITNDLPNADNPLPAVLQE